MSITIHIDFWTMDLVFKFTENAITAAIATSTTTSAVTTTIAYAAPFKMKKQKAQLKKNNTKKEILVRNTSLRVAYTYFVVFVIWMCELIFFAYFRNQSKYI